MYTVEQVIEAGLKAGLYAYQLDQLEKCLEELPKPEPQQLLQQTPCKTHVCHHCGGVDGHTIECTAWCGKTVTV